MSSTDRATVAGAAGMTFVGGSVAVSGLLADAPLHTAQAAALAWPAARCCSGGPASPGAPCIARGAWNGSGWPGSRLSGLVVFNLALVHGSRHAEPAVLAVAVACVPVALAALDHVSGSQAAERARCSRRRLRERRRRRRGGSRARGRRGPALGADRLRLRGGFHPAGAAGAGADTGRSGVSVHSTWMAAAMFTALAAGTEGIWAITRFDIADVAAIGYLALGVTAVAFILWYCV